MLAVPLTAVLAMLVATLMVLAMLGAPLMVLAMLVVWWLMLVLARMRGLLCRRILMRLSLCHNGMLIAVGGPLFNFILSGVLLLILAVAGFGHYRPILNPAPDSSLYTQGVRAGDVIVSIDDSPVRFRRDIATTAIAPIIEDAEVTITVLRPASNEELQATLRHPTSTDSTRFLTEVLAKEIKFLGPPAIVGNIRAGFPAAGVVFATG